MGQSWIEWRHSLPQPDVVIRLKQLDVTRLALHYPAPLPLTCSLLASTTLDPGKSGDSERHLSPSLAVDSAKRHRVARKRKRCSSQAYPATIRRPHSRELNS